MTQIIFVIIGSASIGIGFAEYFFIGVRNLQVKYKIWVWRDLKYVEYGGPIIYTPRRLKPFDCYLCMSFWTCLGLCLFYLHLPPVESILTSCTSCLFSVGVFKLIKP